MLYSLRFSKNRWHLIINYGIGDAYLTCSFIEAFIKKHGEVNLIFTKKNQMFIVDLFISESNKKFAPNIHLNLIREFNTFRKGFPILINANDLDNGILSSIIGYKNISLTDIYKIMLRLGLEEKPSSPSFPEVQTSLVDSFFTHNKIETGKTVVLCPHANTIETIEGAFWQSLAKSIEKIGLIPAFMNYNCDGFISLDFPLELSKVICEKAGFIVSLRSGFCDLISTIETKKIILFPRVKWYANDLIKSTSLINMDLCNSENLLELEVPIELEKDYNPFINTIISFLS
jgi:hypothetical protein